VNREARPAFTFVSERGAPFTIAGLGKLIERADVAAKIGFKVHMHTAKTIPPAVVASALRSSAVANKHESGAHTDPMHRCTWHAGQALPSAVGVAGGWPQTNTPLRSCRPSAQADQTGGGLAA
jgi:hypothetical protein